MTVVKLDELAKMIKLLDSKLSSDIRFEYNPATYYVSVVDNSVQLENRDHLVLSWMSPSSFLFGDGRFIISIFDELTTICFKPQLNRLIHDNPWLLSLKGCESIDEIQLKLAVLGV